MLSDFALPIFIFLLFKSFEHKIQPCKWRHMIPIKRQPSNEQKIEEKEKTVPITNNGLNLLLYYKF